MFALDNIAGIPAHPLIVHIPVVLVPLAFLLVIVASWKRYRTQLLIAAAIAAGIGGIGVLLAAGSGEGLQRAREGAVRQLVHDHTEAGSRAQGGAGVFAAIVIVAAAEEALRRKGKLSKLKLPKWVPSTLLAASIVSGAVGAYMVYDAGHTGAKSVWNGVKAKGEGGERGGDDD
ncbi:MAG: hypothetical protein KJS66_01985 [Acidobacteria bacterium]|nr:hypothetical protein [Acidobacteriota bacterium]